MAGNGTIVFDYNRTLYDPERGGFYPGVDALVQRLAERYRLCVIGRDREGRSGTLDRAGLRECFSEVRFVAEKTPELFAAVVGAGPYPVTVVGDRAGEEIAIGNQLGYRTIWVRKGKFAAEEPDAESGQPTVTVSDVLEVENVLSALSARSSR